MTDNEVLHIGPHKAWIEPPDMFVTHWQGEIGPDHLAGMYDHIDKSRVSYPVALWLNIVKDATAVAPETRRYASRNRRVKPIKAMALVGASFHIRIISNMLIRAASLVGRATPMLITFVDTEEEGRKWLALKRVELAGSAPRTD